MDWFRKRRKEEQMLRHQKDAHRKRNLVAGKKAAVVKFEDLSVIEPPADFVAGIRAMFIEKHPVNIVCGGIRAPKYMQVKIVESDTLPPDLVKAEIRKKSNPFHSGESFIEALKKRGFKKLGSGGYSTVMGKEGSNKVIKVGRNPDNWIDYITWANDNGYAGTFAPKVFSYKHFPHSDKTRSPFYVAVVERLDKTLGELENSHPRRYAADLFCLARGCANDNLKKCLDTVAPGMAKFMDDFDEKFSNHYVDLHKGNFMLREMDFTVLTDPLYSMQSEIGFKRLRLTGEKLAA